MKKVLLSAFACDPTQGSEPGNGWNWALGLAQQGYQVHCLTREVSKTQILSFTKPDNLSFDFIKLPFGLDALYSSSQAGMYLHYLLWQWLAYRKAKTLHKQKAFHLVHHVTWGSVQLGSFLYKIPVPFIFGPAGGGQTSPEAFKKYFGKSWDIEKKRERVSDMLLKYNPACKNMVEKAAAVWVSNPDTFKLTSKLNANKIFSTLDAALPSTFFPANFLPKTGRPESLKLLWVGRFMPRKGVLLLLEVMKQLKGFPGITLTMVGDGEQRDLFLESVIEQGLEETVFWKGKVTFDEVKHFYFAHDAFFFTSLRDSCPAQLIEAMAYGMPVVTLDLHGQSIVVNDDTGFRCACETPEMAITELKKAVLKLYHSASLLTSMSVAAHAFALRQTWDYKIKNIVSQCYPL